MSTRTIRAFKARMAPVGVHVDALWEIRKAMRALRRAERRIMASIRAEKRQLARVGEDSSDVLLSRGYWVRK